MVVTKEQIAERRKAKRQAKARTQQAKRRKKGRAQARETADRKAQRRAAAVARKAAVAAETKARAAGKSRAQVNAAARKAAREAGRAVLDAAAQRARAQVEVERARDLISEAETRRTRTTTRAAIEDVRRRGRPTKTRRRTVRTQEAIAAQAEARARQLAEAGEPIQIEEDIRDTDRFARLRRQGLSDQQAFDQITREREEAGFGITPETESLRETLRPQVDIRQSDRFAALRREGLSDQEAFDQIVREREEGGPEFGFRGLGAEEARRQAQEEVERSRELRGEVTPEGLPGEVGPPEGIAPEEGLFVASQEKAMQILRDALASGQIDQSQFDVFSRAVETWDPNTPLNIENIIAEFDKIKTETIDPFFANLVDQAISDAQFAQQQQVEARVGEEEVQRVTALEDVRRAQRELEASGLLTTGESIRLLGEVSPFVRAGEPGAEITGIPLQQEFAVGGFLEGLVPKQARLVRTSAQARFQERQRRLARQAERELGTERARTAGFGEFLVGGVQGRIATERERFLGQAATGAAATFGQATGQQISPLEGITFPEPITF